MPQYNSVVIGAGHNGLVCATYLAKKGHKVLLVEAAASAGGLASAREFYAGYHVSVAHSVNHFSSKVIKDLDLVSHGLLNDQASMPTIGLGPNGKHIEIQDGMVSGAGDKDALQFRDYQKLMRKFAKTLAPYWHKKIPRIAPGSTSDMMTFAGLGLNLRRLGKKDMLEFLRVFSLPVRDLMDEYFENDQLKALLSMDGLLGSRMAPRSPNSTVLSMLYRQSEGTDCAHSSRSCKVADLIDALTASAQAAGVEIRYSSPVKRITIRGDSNGLRTEGVELNSGEVIEADKVISATDPQRTFIDLVGVQYLDIGFTNRIRRLRCDGYVGKLHLALDRLPKFHGLANTQGRLIIAPDLDSIEFAYDYSKYGEFSESPVMEIVLPSQQDKSLAPEGKHVLSANVMYVPYKLKGGWTDDARDKLCRTSIDTIAHYAPSIRDSIVHAELLTPSDLEAQYRVTGGHWHHTEFAIDQMLMMRPTYEAAQYKTPIPGLFLCGAGSHPGGDLVGAAGHNAAKEVLS